jgi:RNA polymerase sigma factor (sigma-70 family)
MPTDQELVRAALLGHRSAVEQLFLRHEPALRRVIHAGAWQLPADMDAEDVLQSFYERVCARGLRALTTWQGLSGPPDAGIEPYFATIVRNLLVDAGRKKLARQPEEPDDGHDEHPDPDPTPDEAGDTATRRAALAQCIASALSPQQRQVIALYLEDRPHAEIATELGISVANSRVLVNRGLAALRACMDKRLRNVRPDGAVQR